VSPPDSLLALAVETLERRPLPRDLAEDGLALAHRLAPRTC